ncbi:MAG: hypothetical protein M5R38_10545 [Candidatus Methylomirabilis sp.]|nr:hypothetical protein [Candidatus Methylomirabilis sp.]
MARIGGLDERFGSGNFEDDDLCIRAFQVGFRARIALDVFIHHAGSQTFKAAKIDYRQSLMRNWKLFKRKWGIPADSPVRKGVSLSASIDFRRASLGPAPRCRRRPSVRGRRSLVAGTGLSGRPATTR